MHAPISLAQRLHARLGFLAMVALTAVCAAGHASATQVSANHFTLTGSATIKTAASAQSGGSFQINARLSSAVGAEPSSAGGYVMTATLGQAPFVCTSDIIFRNGFDKPAGL